MDRPLEWGGSPDKFLKEVQGVRIEDWAVYQDGELLAVACDVDLRQNLYTARDFLLRRSFMVYSVDEAKLLVSEILARMARDHIHPHALAFDLLQGQCFALSQH